MIRLAAIEFSSLTWLFPAVVILAVTAAAIVWAGHLTAVDRRVRLGCALLKLAGILALAVCLLEPLWIGQRARPGANFFALIADNSESMQAKDSAETRSRGEMLREVLAGSTGDKSRSQRGWQAALEENFQVRRYTFDSRLQTTRAFEELNFEGHASSLGNALRTAGERWRGQPMAGALLFTDGIATDIGGDLPALDGLPPIYPVIVGKDTGLKDISVERVTVSQTSFEDAPVTVQAEIGTHGFQGNDIVARLIEVNAGPLGGETNQTEKTPVTPTGGTNSLTVVAQLIQRVPGSDSALTFRFQVQPAAGGIHFYELDARVRSELDAPAGPSSEATLINNRRMLVVDRGQEPFRVLYVSGRPNWEFKFLNRAIADDQQVQLVALIRVAKREPKFEFMGRPGESSNPLFRGFDSKEEETARYDQPVLVRLNTKDEFELRGGFPKTAEELFRYHAVIVDDLEAEYFSHDQMALLQRFVSERGGGFLMLGGPDSLREGNYARTPVASFLPVYLDRPTEAKLPSEFKLNFTREGWLQPWTRLRPTEAEERARLEAVPPFEVVNPVSEVKPGASVLATVSDPADHTYPALVAQRFGYGRSAVLTIGDLWRWGLRDESMQKDLSKSWRQLVRWLVSDVPPRISITTGPAANGDPTQAGLTIKAHDEEFKPLDNATVELQVRPIRLMSSGSGDSGNNHSATNAVKLTADSSSSGQDSSSSEPGTYGATYVAREPGAYLAEATVTQPDGKLAGKAMAGWVSDPAAEEFRSLKPNRALLETIARRTGGEIVALEDLAKFARRLPERGAPITETFSRPFWHQPAMFLFVLVCFVAEWGLRRWKGLP